jgi:hypothetical protein
MRFCFISIVKRGHLLLLIFYPTKKSRKEKKNQKIQEDIHEENLEDCPGW